MSDEARAHVKEHSPFTGQTFWLHYVLADIANKQHGYEIWITDARLAEEWPLPQRSITRGRAELLEGGHLTLIEPGKRGQAPRYRFEFVKKMGGHPGHPSEEGLGGQDDELGGQTRAVGWPNSRSSPITNQREQKVTEPTLLAFDETPSTASLVAVDPNPFTAFWEAYPKRDGKKVGKRLCETIWGRLSASERSRAMIGVRHYGAACAEGLTRAKDPERFLKHRVFEDWQEPATPDRVVAIGGRGRDSGRDFFRQQAERAMGVTSGP